MEQIGKITEMVRGAPGASAASPAASHVPARVGDSPPALFDRETDLALPRRLFATIIVDGRPREIVRALTGEERTQITVRRDTLRVGLAPFAPRDSDKVSSAIAAMLGGFRSMRQDGEDAEDLVAVTRFILREFPRWAIEEGCLLIAQGRAGIDRRFPPNDAQIHAVVVEAVRLRRATLATMDALLTAPIEPPEARRPLTQGRPRSTGLANGAPRDTGHAARVLADIAARKAQQPIETKEGESPCATD